MVFIKRSGEKHLVFDASFDPHSANIQVLPHNSIAAFGSQLHIQDRGYPNSCVFFNHLDEFTLVNIMPDCGVTQFLFFDRIVIIHLVIGYRENRCKGRIGIKGNVPEVVFYR
ncbi:hypothetical protein D3C86_1446450 [compost metagenome]